MYCIIVPVHNNCFAGMLIGATVISGITHVGYLHGICGGEVIMHRSIRPPIGSESILAALLVRWFAGCQEDQ